jgi:DnaJ family protein C protein 3
MVRLSTLALAAGILSGPTAFVAGLTAEDIPSDTPVSALLSSAQIHLSKGETSNALLYYDAAIARDPSNYLTFFKRATTYLSLGRTSQATDDFNKVLALKPGFEGAHLQLGKIRARIADWEGAKEQFVLAKKEPDSKEVTEIEEAHGAAVLAETAEKEERWEDCVNQLDVAVQVATRSLALRQMRAKCRFESGRLQGGVGDLMHVLQMKPGDTGPHIKIAAINFYALGQRPEAMAQLRKCLHSDPDSKVCKKLLKEMKATDKKLLKVEEALGRSQPMTAVRQLVPTADQDGLIKEVKDRVEAFREDGTIPKSAENALATRLVEMACQAYYDVSRTLLPSVFIVSKMANRQLQASSKKAKEYCEESLQMDENSFYGLLYKAKVQLEAEEFEASMNTLQKAAEAHPDKKETVNPLLQKADVALRRSKSKDYYKVLGVAHDADERQIKAAYRKLSKQHHPDKAAKQGLTKEDAEKKMASINEAYEVLSDPELRARFDRGDDPNSNEQNQHPFHGSPFGQGRPFMFQQGGGGGGGSQQFQFQFGGGGFPGGFPFG